MALSLLASNPRSSLRQRQPGGTHPTGFAAGSASPAPPIQSNTNARASRIPAPQYHSMSTFASSRSYTGRHGFTDFLSRHTVQTPINRLLCEIQKLLGELRDEVDSYAFDDPAVGLALHVVRCHVSLSERVEDLGREIQSMSADAVPPPYSREDPITVFRNNDVGTPLSPSGATRNHDAGQISTPVTAVRRNDTRSPEARLPTASQLRDPRILALDIEEWNRRLRIAHDEFVEELLSQEEVYVDAAEERDLGVVSGRRVDGRGMSSGNDPFADIMDEHRDLFGHASRMQ
ncbi:hypothetical protein BDZ85DRAFT_277376 [Elsinoe ampelina]|uniref:Uncharacterized protein n=1 Tax=Elsinoe ampelina TaxID=302913 RepID=A0A6A6GPR5_9PEZI|nr:hypothetical protein BDZ85DRAFT_277376 [Elsinoe ampelina]